MTLGVNLRIGTLGARFILLTSFFQGTQQVKEAEIQDPRSDVALRKDLEKWMQEKRAKTKSRITGSRKPEKIQPETGIIQPEYEIKQSKNVNMQDYVGNGCQGLSA